MDNQKYIDIELLKSYRTATEEQRALLDKLYGKDTFIGHVDPVVAEFAMVYALIRDNESSIDRPEASRTYPVQWGDKVIGLKITLHTDESATESLRSGKKYHAFTDILNAINKYVTFK